jgi:hypothetical protein
MGFDFLSIHVRFSPAKQIERVPHFWLILPEVGILTSAAEPLDNEA